MSVIWLFSALLTPITSAAESKCVSTHFDEKVYVDYVIDGDTVILTDKRHVRLIGIDTPEIFHDGRVAEAGAHQARKRLQSLLADDAAIGLRYDEERQDRHGRTLAHLLLADGRNIQSLLLEEGLAMPLFIPPSVGLASCYAAAANTARAARRGLWQFEAYRPVAVNQLHGNEQGFHILQGKVKTVSESRSSIWINLENNVAFRITRSDLRYFDETFLASLVGKKVEAHGWLYQRNKQSRMRIRYPLNLTIMSSQE